VLVSFVYLVACRLFALVLLLARSDRSKELELLVLRHELSILRRQARRPQLRESDRLVLAALSRVMPRRSWQAFPVTPETLLRWHRRIIARRWTYPHRRPGRPAVDQEVRQLILRLARENSHWGYVRIVGELRKLGITVSATLVRNALARAGIPPAPERVASSWRSFLRQHGDTILACDLFTVDTVWLRRLYVLFFVSIGTRRVEYVACTRKPDTLWMTQQARNLLMELDDRSRRPRFLIHDRDTKFNRGFDAIFRSDGIEIVRTPIQAPNAKRLRRTLGRQRAQGVPRPAPDLRSAPARARPPRLHPPLQPAASTPSARPATAGSRQWNRSSAHSDPLHASGPTARPPRRTAPRIRSRGVKIVCAPHGVWDGLGPQRQIHVDGRMRSGWRAATYRRLNGRRPRALGSALAVVASSGNTRQYEREETRREAPRAVQPGPPAARACEQVRGGRDRR
jgi:putative transposase